MKRLINKENPDIIISAPEIKPWRKGWYCVDVNTAYCNQLLLPQEDWIFEIDGEPVDDFEEFRKLIDNYL